MHTGEKESSSLVVFLGLETHTLSHTPTKIDVFLPFFLAFLQDLTWQSRTIVYCQALPGGHKSECQTKKKTKQNKTEHY
jgi:hypothetical protein